MNLPSNALATSSRLASPVVELRQYTLKPGKRDTLIDIFDTHLITGQEDAGMTIIGQFRDLDRPDLFVWMRGFDGMEARKDALTAFYEGPVWGAYSNAANATMIDSDDVLLLKPVWPGASFDLSGLQRPASGEVENKSDKRCLPGIVGIRIHHLRPDAGAGYAERFETDAAPLLAANGARLLGAFISEHAENTFPRLPVRSGENVLLVVTGFDNEDARTGHLTALAASPAWQAFLGKAEPDLTRPTETLRLSPTSRSLLGLALQ